MSRYWTFRDYVDPSGENVIYTWLHGLPKAARVRINVIVQYLEATPKLGMPYANVLTGPCAGLIELRITAQNVQYRPLVCYGPGRREVTLLVGAIEKGGRFEPQSAGEIGLARKAQIAERGRTCEHDFS